MNSDDSYKDECDEEEVDYEEVCLLIINVHLLYSHD